MDQVTVPTGKYVVAASGGIDSMVLVHILAGRPGLELVVAHFDHGMRPDADQDRQLVQATAERYGLVFVHAQGRLGAGASEATARHARYLFLEQVRAGHGATAIITAHHQDDVLETAIINIVRGTGRKGLSALGSRSGLLRPLLDVSRQAIVSYASAHPDIRWREDSTNSDERYLRNYIRRHVIPRLDGAGRQRLLGHIEAAQHHNPAIDELLSTDIAAHSHDGALDRRWFIGLPHDVSCEVMAAWLRAQGIRDFDRKQIARLVVLAKVGRPGKRGDVVAGYWLDVGKARLKLDR